MLTTVQFNGKLGLFAREVQNKWPYRMLAAKLIAIQLPITYPPPEAFFHLRRTDTQITRALDTMHRNVGFIHRSSSSALTRKPKMAFDLSRWERLKV